MSAFIKTFLALAVLAILGLAAFTFSGVYNVAADAPHTAAMHSWLATLRDRSIAFRSDEVEARVPGDEAALRVGAEHYAAMCAGCHLAPGRANTELRQGLYPTPPDLARHGIRDPARAFWVIKHGVKFTGMPAWGRTHDDPTLWSVVAFLERLPQLSAEEYDRLAGPAAGEGGGHGHGHDEPRADGSEPGAPADASGDGHHDHEGHEHGDH